MTHAPKALTAAFIRSLKTLRKESKLTNDELGRLCGVGETTLRSWLSGRARPSAESIQSVEKSLHTKLAWLDRLSAAIENALPRSS